MTFADIPGLLYIKKTRVFVNSANRTLSSSRSGFDFAVQLGTPLTQIIGAELVQYNIPRACFPLWLGTYDWNEMKAIGVVTKRNTTSNMLSDVSITDETGANTYNFVLSMDPAHSRNALTPYDPFPYSGYAFSPNTFLFTDPNGFWNQETNYKFNLSTDPVVNNVNYTLAYTVDVNNRVSLTATNNFAPTFARVRFLNGSGSNSENQMSNWLGFVSDKDTEPIADNNYSACGPFAAHAHPFRYIDVSIAELPEFMPFARIYGLDEGSTGSGITFDFMPGFVTPDNIQTNMRLMKQPVREMHQLSIKVTAPGGKLLPWFADHGIMFTIDIYSLVAVPKIPKWLIQRML